MARAHFVRRARKPVKHAGIKVGDSYYWWQFRHGPKQYSKTPPRQSQLTASDKMSRAYAAAEALEDLVVGDDTELDDLRSDVEQIASDVEEIAQEYRDAIDNMPENLQQSPTAELCENNADELESWAQEISSCLDSVDEDDKEWRDTAISAIQEVAGSMPL